VPVLTLGISYRHAPVELLERLAFGSEDLPKAYRQLTDLEPVRGGVIVSTCNRVEVVAEVESYHAGFQVLRGFLSESREVPFEDFADILYTLYEDQAIRHLFSVASGLDSMVLGEPQILSQIRSAFRGAEAEDAPGSLLHALFRRAIRVGRRARAETEIGASPAAFVQAGAALAERTLGGLEERRVAVVGAGAMGDIAVRTLTGRGINEVTILNRTKEKAESLARRTGARARPFEELPDAVREADLVVSFTGATGFVLERAAIVDAARGRTTPLVLIDLAVPRDVDPSVGELPGVRLVDIDGLRDLVEGADRAEIERVRAIIDQEVDRFMEWRRAKRLAPLIQGIYDRGERIRAAELERVRGRLSRLSDEERAAVEATTKAVVAKLLHHPIVLAKKLDEGDEAEIHLLARLFDLEPPPPA
jgi:glutamyl-tRNA reductase